MHWRAKAKRGKDAGSANMQAYWRDRGRRVAPACSRQGGREPFRAGPYAGTPLRCRVPRGRSLPALRRRPGEPPASLAARAQCVELARAEPRDVGTGGEPSPVEAVGGCDEGMGPHADDEHIRPVLPLAPPPRGAPLPLGPSTRRDRALVGREDDAPGPVPRVLTDALGEDSPAVGVAPTAAERRERRPPAGGRARGTAGG